MPTAVTEDESKVRDSWVVVNRIASDGEGAENGHKDRPKSLESDPKSVKSPTPSSCGELPSQPEGLPNNKVIFLTHVLSRTYCARSVR